MGLPGKKLLCGVTLGGPGCLVFSATTYIAFRGNWNLPSDLSSHHVATPPSTPPPRTQFSLSEGEKEPLGVELFGFTWDSGPRSIASLARLRLHGLPVTGLHGS